jgi:hypothetical protein
MTLSYADAIDYLYSLINYEVQRPERYAPDVVSLERPRALWRRSAIRKKAIHACI